MIAKPSKNISNGSPKKNSQDNDPQVFCFFSDELPDLTFDDPNSNFCLADGEQVTFSNLPPSSYTISELFEPGWHVSGIGCTPGDAEVEIDLNLRRLTVHLAEAQDVTCGYVNARDATATPTPSLTPTATPTPSPTPTPSATATPDETEVPTATQTAVPTATNTPTSTPQAIPPTLTPTPTPTQSPTPTATPSAVPTATPTPTGTPTPTPTATPTGTPTPTPSATPTLAASATPTPTPTLEGPTCTRTLTLVSFTVLADTAGPPSEVQEWRIVTLAGRLLDESEVAANLGDGEVAIDQIVAEARFPRRLFSGSGFFSTALVWVDKLDQLSSGEIVFRSVNFAPVRMPAVRLGCPDSQAVEVTVSGRGSEVLLKYRWDVTED